LLHRKCRRCPARDEKIDIGVDETRRELRQLFVLFCPPLLDDQVLPIDVPELTEPLNEYPEILAWSGADGKKADAGDLVGRLRWLSTQEDKHKRDGKTKDGSVNQEPASPP